MASHRCKTECFFNSHLYQVGEEAQFNPGETVPEHFERIDGEGEPDVGAAKQNGKGKTKPDAGA